MAGRSQPDEVDDLLAFAEVGKLQTGTPCLVCAMPERAVFDEAKRRAKPRMVGGTMVRRWLVARYGYTEESLPNRQAFEHHFHRGHHLEESS